ncbi:hypothetical protein Plhal703r1_c12g0061151 [Plasmopara halstedii]
MARKWFQLVDENGNDLMSADAVVVDIEDVAALRDAVKAKCPNKLANVDAAHLTVFDANGVALPWSSSSVSKSGEDEDNAIIVQVPPRAAVLEPNLLQIILPHILANAPTTLTERDNTFKEQLCEYYGCFRRKKAWVRCMLLDVAFPRSLVLASHLFRRNNEYLSLAMMQISDIDNEKNGLLLFKPIKYALDHFQISFIRDDSDVFRLKLDDELTKKQRGVLLDSVSRANERCTFDMATTFGNLDGKPLVFIGLERPFYRCLNLQARVARMIALKNNRIDASYDFEDFWTEVSLNDKMEIYLAGIAASALTVFDTKGVASPWSSSSVSKSGEDEDNAIIVQVPPRAAVLEPNLLQIILPHILANAPTTLTERDNTFKEQLCEYYGCFRRKKAWVRCMLLDVAFPRSLVLASHLFRRNNEYLSLAMMQISDIDNEKNGLLLFKPIKYALDHFQISFIRDDSDVFRLKLFDYSINDTRIIDLKDRKGNDVLTKKQRGVLLNSVSRANERCTFDIATTFGNLDGKPLVFTGLERPFYRCLNLQARVARMIALKNNRIDASYDFEDFWTEVSLNDKMEMFHRSIMNTDPAMF